MSCLDDLRELAKAPTVDWLEKLDRHTKGVAEAMTAIHGGRWKVSVNHRTGLVMIGREFEGWQRQT